MAIVSRGLQHGPSWPWWIRSASVSKAWEEIPHRRNYSLLLFFLILDVHLDIFANIQKWRCENVRVLSLSSINDLVQGRHCRKSILDTSWQCVFVSFVATPACSSMRCVLSKSCSWWFRNNLTAVENSHFMAIVPRGLQHGCSWPWWTRSVSLSKLGKNSTEKDLFIILFYI